MNSIFSPSLENKPAVVNGPKVGCEVSLTHT